MQGRLINIYWRILIPGLAGIIILELLKTTKLIAGINFQGNNYISLGLVILAALFSIAIPVLYRSIFISGIRNNINISQIKFIRFETRLIIISLVSPYLVIAASVFIISEFHYTIIILCALYSCYYYYPSKKRINSEKKIFRILENQSK